jgi:IMP dehydrogenase
VPLIADGGIKFSGDLTKAIGAGAHCVMIGGPLCGHRREPRRDHLFQGRSYKVYRGMGSLEAMKQGSKDRYYQTEQEPTTNWCPKASSAACPTAASLTANIHHQLIGGLKAGMGYVGCRTIDELREKAVLSRSAPPGCAKAMCTTSSSPRRRPTTGSEIF